jgi:conjugative relaxase-like TrwC/TraI family protein
MLRIVQNQAPSSAKTYYSAGAYYSEGQELAGVWRGKAAAQLGLKGKIEQCDFDALCDNLNPQTGDRLTARTRTGRTVGYDVNVHVPKGVSLAYMLNGDDRILRAFEDSLNETMAEFERDAQTRVRVGGRDQNRSTGNLVWGEFIHKTARPVRGLPDPHLHAHCFVFNVTFDPIEKRFKAAQFRLLKQDAPYYEALVHARLARRLAALGYTIERIGRSWDIAEVPKTLRDRFSRRRDQIEELARERGITDAIEKDGLGARSREPKLKEFTIPELLDRWRVQLRPDELSAIQPPSAQQKVDGMADHRAASEAVAAAIAHCFGQSAVLPERSVLAEALRRGVGRVDPAEVASAARNGMIVRTINGHRLATTEAALRDGREIIEPVRAGSGVSRRQQGQSKLTPHQLQRQAAAERHAARDRIAGVEQAAEPRWTGARLETADGT